MITNKTKQRKKESSGAAGLPVLRLYRTQVTKQRRKRALSSVSLRASLTIEAALGLTLFMFTVILLSVPMEILDTQRKVQTVLESVGRELGWQVYRPSHQPNEAEMEAGQGKTEMGEELTASLPMGMLLPSYLKEKIQAAAGARVSGIQCQKSRVSEDGSEIDLYASYRVRLPFSVFSLDQVNVSSRCRKRGWVGARGGYFSRAGKQDDLETWVYVGRDSTRYHRSASCHYISNQITATAYKTIREQLNREGRHYKACQICGKNISADGMVYVLPAGEAYHTRQDCSSLAYYVRRVRLSEVEHLGVCSYCGR